MWMESYKLAAKPSEVGFHNIVFNTLKAVLKATKGYIIHSRFIVHLKLLQVVINVSTFRTLHFYTTIKKIMKLSCF